MKTQINNLINGQKNVIRNENDEKYINAPMSSSHDEYAGTNYNTRREVARRVFEENPEYLNVEVRGIKFNMPIGSSLSGKTRWFSCLITPEDYLRITGAKELPYKHETTFVLHIDELMKVRIMKSTRHSERAQWKYRGDICIGEEFVNIL